MNSVFCREVLHNEGLMHAKNWNVSFVWPSCKSMKPLSELDWDEKSLYLLYLKERKKSYIIQDGRTAAILKTFYWHIWIPMTCQTVGDMYQFAVFYYCSYIYFFTLVHSHNDITEILVGVKHQSTNQCTNNDEWHPFI